MLAVNRKTRHFAKSHTIYAICIKIKVKIRDSYNMKNVINALTSGMIYDIIISQGQTSLESDGKCQKGEYHGRNEQL